jgi:hypothetical protein
VSEGRRGEARGGGRKGLVRSNFQGSRAPPPLKQLLCGTTRSSTAPTRKAKRAHGRGRRGDRARHGHAWSVRAGGRIRKYWRETQPLPPFSRCPAAISPQPTSKISSEQRVGAKESRATLGCAFSWPGLLLCHKRRADQGDATPGGRRRDERIAPLVLAHKQKGCNPIRGGMYL